MARRRNRSKTQRVKDILYYYTPYKNTPACRIQVAGGKLHFYLLPTVEVAKSPVALLSPPSSPFLRGRDFRYVVIFILLQRLREELRELALRQCKDSVAKFAGCATDNGIWLVISCREQNRLSESVART